MPNAMGNESGTYAEASTPKQLRREKQEEAKIKKEHCAKTLNEFPMILHGSLVRKSTTFTRRTDHTDPSLTI